MESVLYKPLNILIKHNNHSSSELDLEILQKKQVCNYIAPKLRLTRKYKTCDD